MQLLFKDSKVHQDSNSQSRNSLESVRVHSFTLFYTPKSMRCDSQVSLLARNLANPCLGCKPKARVATMVVGSQNSFLLDHYYKMWV